MGWRRKTQRWLEDRGLSVYNPCTAEAKYLKKYDVKASPHKWESLPQAMREEIIRRDLEQVAKYTTFVVCYYTKPSSGTTKEMVHAWLHGVPLYIVTKRRIRGWEGDAARASSSKVFPEFVDLYNHLSYKYKLRKRKTTRRYAAKG
jgi:hypothetical protein